MKKTAICMALVALFGLGVFATDVFAEENTEKNNSPTTSMTLKPVSKIQEISADSKYDGTLTISNDGDADIKVQVYATPYSYVYSDAEDVYKLGFSNENKYTQMSRWITIKDSSGNYTEKPIFTIKPKESLNVEYRITTPKSIPAGGQYAVIFAQTISENVDANGIKTEASTGMVLYGHSTEGETVVSAEFNDMEIGQGKRTKAPAASTGQEESADSRNIYGFAKAKNTGNVDFFVRGELKVEPIIGFSSYTTPDDAGKISVIPESERIIEDSWKETPSFGIYKVTWTLSAGEQVESIERVIFIISPWVIILTIMVLTACVVVIIIIIRKRKERRSRLAI